MDSPAVSKLPLMSWLQLTRLKKPSSKIAAFFFSLSQKLKSSSAPQVTIVPHRPQRLKPRKEKRREKSLPRTHSS